MKNNVGSIRTRLANALLFYRNTPHSITKMAPSVALNGRKYVTVREKMNPSFVPSPDKLSKNLKSFSVGDSVLALNLRESPKWCEGTVVEKLGVNVYNLSLIHI